MVSRGLHAVVDHVTGCLEGEGSSPVHAILCYLREDPWAVVLTAATGGRRPLVWIFARDLLDRGLFWPTGLGDVGVAPSDDEVCIRLTLRGSGRSTQKLLLDRVAVAAFLVHTYEVVPRLREREHFDVDTALAALLA